MSSTSRDESNVSGSSSSSASASSVNHSNKRRRESSDAQNMEQEESFKILVEMQMVTMETQIDSMEVLAQKIPSDRKLPLALKKIRQILADYKSGGTGNFETESEVEVDVENPTAKRVRMTKESQPESQKNGNHMNGAEKAKTADKELKILGLIQKYVDFNASGVSLKSAPVSKMWDEKGRKKFLENDFLQLPSDFLSELDKSEYKQQILLDEIKEWFSGLGFELGSISKIILKNQSDVKLFTDLKILGEKIHNIKINLSTLKSTEYAQVLNSTIINCPNLTFLDVQENQGAEKKLTREEKSFFGFDLMEACGKTRRRQLTISQLFIDLCPKNWMKFLNQLNQPDSESESVSVEESEEEEYFPQHFWLYKDFAQSGVRLKNLTIFHWHLDENSTHFNILVEAVSKILESSKDTLCNFTYDSSLCLNILNKVKAPVMRNLHTLNITASIDGSTKSIYFQQGFKFPVHLPNLKTVELNLHVHPGALGFREEESIGRAKSVKTLEFKNYGGHDSQLEIFQEVEELSFSFAHGELASVWKCKKLKKLNIFNVYSSSRESLIRVLAGLVGKKEEDFENLWKKKLTSGGYDFGVGELNMDSSLIEALKPSTGIVELQDLETLIIKVDCRFSHELKDNFLSLFRALIAEFMPKLGNICLVEEEKPFLKKLNEKRVQVRTEDGKLEG